MWPTTMLLSMVLLTLLSCTPDRQAQPATVARSEGEATALPGALATPGADAAVPGPERQAPLTALGACASAPPHMADDEVAGLVLPDGAVLTRVTPADPLTNVQGYLPMTPVQVRAFYQEHPGLDVVSVEDEVHESETLVEVDGYRLFVKAQAVCELGSLFVAIVAPAS